MRLGLPKNMDELLDAIGRKIPPLRAFAVKDPGVDRFEPGALNDFAVLRAFLETYFRVDIEGVENLPNNTGALLVGNHGRTGLDAFVFAGIAPEKIGRPIRALADRALFRLPGFRDWMAVCGAVPGTRENAVRLLEEGNLVVVYPGGNKEVFKSADDAYKLLWDERLGFIHVAKAAGVPIVPFAGLGVEEMYTNLPGWDAVEHSRLAKILESKLGKPPGFPPMVGLGLLPAPVKLTFRIGMPMPTHQVDAENRSDMLSFQREVKNSVQHLLGEGLSRRLHLHQEE